MFWIKKQTNKKTNRERWMCWKILKQVVNKRILHESGQFSGLRKISISRPSFILGLKKMKGGILPEWPFLENILETMREFFFPKESQAGYWTCTRGRSRKPEELGILLSTQWLHGQPDGSVKSASEPFPFQLVLLLKRVQVKKTLCYNGPKTVGIKKEQDK